MITVRQLIEKLQEEDQNAIVLLDGYEWGMEFLRTKDATDYVGGIVRGKFNLPENPENDFSDRDTCGGLLSEDENGSHNFILFKRGY